MTMESTTAPFVARRLDLAALLKSKSHFLFGPRQRKLGPVLVLPWRQFLEQLWSGALR